MKERDTFNGVYASVFYVKRQLYAVRLDRDLLVGMKRLERQVGIPQSEQIRRALRKRLVKNGGLRRSGAHRLVRHKG